MRSTLMVLATAAVAFADHNLQAYTFCEVGVTTVSAGVAGTAFELTRALQSCADIKAANCTRDVIIAKDVYAGVARLSPKVVGYCNGTAPLCASEVVAANAAVSKAASPMAEAASACAPNGTATECRIRLATVNAEMASAGLKLAGASKECHTNRTALKESKFCEYEVDAVTAGIATTTEELARAVKACSDITSANCSSDVAKASATLTATRVASAKGVTLCGKTTPCGEDVASINGTLSKAQTPVAAAVAACKAGGEAATCHFKLASANAEVATAGLAAAKAHSDCKANATSADPASDL